MKTGQDHSSRGEWELPDPSHEKYAFGGLKRDRNIETMTSEDEAWNEVVNWLSRLRLLQGVPFVYIVPTEEMLPNESIRFYHMDRNWLDSLVDGAISVGSFVDSKGSLPSVPDDNQIVKYQRFIDELNYSTIQNNPYRNHLLQQHKADAQGHYDAKNSGEMMDDHLTGFLLRSTVVRDYPGMEVSAYLAVGVDSEEDNLWAIPKHKVQTIHQVRLSETILFCIFNGVPTHLRLQEPGEGIRLGLDPHDPPLDDPINTNAHIRNRFTLKFKKRDGDISDDHISEIKYRKYTDDRSVIDIKGILTATKKMEASHFPIEVPPAINFSDFEEKVLLKSGGLVATQLMQYPYQQDFGYDSITQTPYKNNSELEATVERSDILNLDQAKHEDSRFVHMGDEESSDSEGDD